MTKTTIKFFVGSPDTVKKDYDLFVMREGNLICIYDWLLSGTAEKVVLGVVYRNEYSDAHVSFDKIIK